MHPITRSSRSRHIVFFGETGSGKSSVINILLEAGDAHVSNNFPTCNRVVNSARYETSLYGLNYCLWDTRSLCEGRNLFQNVLGRGSVKDLKIFLRERHRNREIDLLVYCIHGSTAFKVLAKNYDNFCSKSRRLAAPVAVVVTGLEGEQYTEDWWDRNASTLRMLEMDFDDHACIVNLPGPHLAESKEKLINLIIRNHCWEPKEWGSYFGSRVQISTQSVPLHRRRGRMIWNCLELWCQVLSRTITLSTRSHTSPNVPPGGLISVPADFGSRTGSSPGSMYHSCKTLRPELPTERNKGFLGGLRISDLTEAIKRSDSFSTYGGVFGDVWECELHSGGSSRKVAVKVIKTKPEKLESDQKKLQRELRIWWKLQHKNIVPLLGVTSGFGRLSSPVSPWFSNGSLSSYLTTHHTLESSERRHLLWDIAAGLCYLHSQDIVHGDLHSDNVLIDDKGTACLMDFGLSLVKEFLQTSYLTSGICGNVVFADPALVKRAKDDRDIFYLTKPCDVYSFGGLALHVLSGRKPYDGIHPTSIFLAVINGERPQIPTGIVLQDGLVMRSCWDHKEYNRPSADRLAEIFSD